MPGFFWLSITILLKFAELLMIEKEKISLVNNMPPRGGIFRFPEAIMIKNPSFSGINDLRIGQ